LKENVMGEWSDYFEDFPDENPANYVNGRFDPKGAEERNRQSARAAQVRAESAALQQKMLNMAAEARAAAEKRTTETAAQPRNSSASEGEA
jgi:hypothetical protein